MSESQKKGARPDLNQGPADLQPAALATELCTKIRCEVCKESTVGATEGASAKMENCDDIIPPLVDQDFFFPAILIYLAGILSESRR